ncbi:response regulator [Aquabacterium sp.]|uniref:response regulator n=1 Tax=Aquabacterium sp. TaxID=1872578 RepID=UPI0035B30770
MKSATPPPLTLVGVAPEPGAAAAPVDLPIDQLVRRDRIRMLYSHVRVTVLVAGAFAAMMCWLLAPMLQSSLVWPWLVAKCVVLVPRWLQAMRYGQASNRSQEHWYRCAVLLAFLDGLVWGAAVWLVSPADRADVMAITIGATLGIGAIGSFALAIDLRAVAALIVPMTLPNIVYCGLLGNRFGAFTSVGLLVFMTILLLEAKRAQRRVTELLTLRYTTERVAKEREQALALAEHHSEAKSRFLATMSHEMRTPLHGILGLARMLHDDEHRPLARNRLELLQRSGDHLLTVINDVLDFSKIEAGYLRVENKRFELSALVDEVIGVLSVAAAQKGLSLSLQYELPRPCTVLGDPARLRQVALNLLSNAIKFTEHGRVALRVRAGECEGEVHFAVQDTGIGIDAREVARIFEAFHQVESTFARRHAGTGLGLTISRKLCQAMGGELTCASQPDEGSTFAFALPLSRVDEPAVSALEPDQPSLWAGPGVQVLLVEDNPVNALVAEAILQQAGVAVTSVADGLAAVEWLERRQADLVLMDCQMPGMDGFEATRQIRRREQQRAWQRVPIVALTANAHDADRQRCLEAGMNDHLAKPFSREALLAVLERYVGGQPFERRARA